MFLFTGYFSVFTALINPDESELKIGRILLSHEDTYISRGQDCD